MLKIKIQSQIIIIKINKAKEIRESLPKDI